MKALFGIFVGGQGSRMGGAPKGLLALTQSGETILERTLREIRTSAPDAQIVLVGQRPEYAHVPLFSIPDEPVGVGPLAGLNSLLTFADTHGYDAVIALACDMPYIASALLSRLLSEKPDARALAPRFEGRWQPLFARYATSQAALATRTALTRQKYALFGVLDALAAEELVLSPEEQRLLSDWDTPEDVELGL
jgi:molybdopterin-guanine dinucleotide biosynthesis protein A